MGRPIKYDFAALAVGESISIPLVGELAKEGSDKAVLRLRKASEQHQRRYGGQFRTRTARAEGLAICERVG
jgi:hypothetical protein